jgi:hypothetical protein
MTAMSTGMTHAITGRRRKKSAAQMDAQEEAV